MILFVVIWLVQMAEGRFLTLWKRKTLISLVSVSENDSLTPFPKFTLIKMISKTFDQNFIAFFFSFFFSQIIITTVKFIYIISLSFLPLIKTPFCQTHSDGWKDTSKSLWKWNWSSKLSSKNITIPPPPTKLIFKSLSIWLFFCCLLFMCVP